MALLALALRLLPIGWGAGLRPHEGFYHPDEPKVFASTAGFPGNYLSNPILIYGTAVQYGLGVVLLPAKVLWAWGLRPPPFEHYGHFVLLAERGLHVLLGVLTLLVLYRLGLRLFDRRVALLASALLAISPLHVLNSALATLDVPAAFLATLVLLLSLRASFSERRRDFVWLGLAAGALLGTKIAAAVALVAPLTLLVAGRSQHRLVGRWALAGGIAAAVFLITTPALVVKTGDYLAFMSDQHATWVAARPHDLLSILAVQAASLGTALGWPTALLGLAGLAAAVARSEARDRLGHLALLAVLLAHVVFWRGYAPARFALLVVPMLCLYAALSLVLLLTAGGVLRRAGLGALALAFAFSAWATAGGLRQRTGDDPRTLAAREIVVVVPQGATVALAAATESDPWTGHAWRYPRLPDGAYVFKALLDRPAYIVTTSYVLRRIAPLVARPEGGVATQDEVRWFHGRVPSPPELHFYRALLGGTAGYTLERSWKPAGVDPVEFAAPEIRLYRRVGPEAAAVAGGAGAERPR